MRMISVASLVLSDLLLDLLLDLLEGSLFVAAE
jgi:hypothetical protein